MWLKTIVSKAHYNGRREVDSIKATQDKGQFPSEVVGNSIADNQAIREIPRGQTRIPQSQLLEYL